MATSAATTKSYSSHLLSTHYILGFICELEPIRWAIYSTITLRVADGCSKLKIVYSQNHSKFL